jgi:hypothetical protein
VTVICGARGAHTLNTLAGEHTENCRTRTNPYRTRLLRLLDDRNPCRITCCARAEAGAKESIVARRCAACAIAHQLQNLALQRLRISRWEVAGKAAADVSRCPIIYGAPVSH